MQVQINELKSEQEILIKKRENKRSSMRWLQRQKSSKFGEELAQINQMINDIEETVSELSTQIDELEEKITAQSKQVKQMSGQLILKEKEKEQLLTKMDKILKEKRHIESELEEDRRLFENEMQRMVFELESSEVGKNITFFQQYSVIKPSFFWQSHAVKKIHSSVINIKIFLYILIFKRC